jgi:hypothetical protein
VRRRSEALLAEVLAMGRQQGVFDIVHLEATAAAIGGIGIRVANWYPPPEAGLNASQLADVYASLALRMARARQPASKPSRKDARAGTAHSPRQNIHSVRTAQPNWAGDQAVQSGGYLCGRTKKSSYSP